MAPAKDHYEALTRGQGESTPHAILGSSKRLWLRFMSKFHRASELPGD